MRHGLGKAKAANRHTPPWLVHGCTSATGCDSDKGARSRVDGDKGREWGHTVKVLPGYFGRWDLSSLAELRCARRCSRPERVERRLLVSPTGSREAGPGWVGEVPR